MQPRDFLMDRPKSIDDLTEQQKIELDPVAFGIYVNKSFQAHREGVFEEAKGQIIKASWDEAFEIVYGSKLLNTIREDGMEEQRVCTTCAYEPEWGTGKYNAMSGECRWPCPPCLRKMMWPISRDKLFECPAWQPKESNG